jgi:hypothetical protein
MICPYMSAVDLDGNLVKVKCLEYECAKYVQIIGTDKNTGKDVSEWKCSDAWLPLLLIDNTQEARISGATMDSLRNHVAETGQALVRVAEASRSLTHG